MEKIIEKLKELKTEVGTLKNLHHSKGKDRFNEIDSLLRRMIDRTYPEKDAKSLKDELVNKFWILTGNETDDYWQKTYLDKIDRAIRVVETIIEEYNLFGFDDFKSITEKVETEAKIKMGLFSLGRKTTKGK